MRGLPISAPDWEDLAVGAMRTGCTKARLDRQNSGLEVISPTASDLYVRRAEVMLMQMTGLL